MRLGTDKINTETMVHINEQPNLQNVKPTKLHDDNSEKGTYFILQNYVCL